MFKERQVHLPPYRVDKVPRILVDEELSNWGIRKMEIEKIWAKGITGEGVKVAVLDTGCNHRDIKMEKFVNFTDDEDEDKCGHGTWVAGEIGANGRFKGIAPGCKLYIAKVLGNDGSGEWSWLEKGLKWALQEGCEVINISAGGDVDNEFRERMKPILRELADKGKIVVCAAGNEKGLLIFPADNLHTLAVGATDEKGEKAAFSNFGPRLVVMAPGVSLLGCWLDNGYAKLSGTSMACPATSGVLTLEEEKHQLTLTEAIFRFVLTSEDIGKVGWQPDSGWGSIAAQKFLLLEKTSKKLTIDWFVTLASFIIAYYVGDEEYRAKEIK